MNITAITIVCGLVLMVASGFAGGYINHASTKHQYDDYVKIEKTKSGNFYIKDQHIYSVSELQTENQFVGNMTRIK